ncbi:hypothetical protein M885DRAFT_515188 [Pelagophyceae sp. CCMP2097]|nr:hypothetical protein M885DRAFT_515188 [Pelagophyceae sp. CCMP2097]|mmetsp:Transcript_9667/g.31881  ORF Transcript_9667/g.31881 Transcript_9667/m.31881 type:complete len:208 (-) Transcript_9667:99-722(-)
MTALDDALARRYISTPAAKEFDAGGFSAVCMQATFSVGWALPFARPALRRYARDGAKERLGQRLGLACDTGLGSDKGSDDGEASATDRAASERGPETIFAPRDRAKSLDRRTKAAAAASWWDPFGQGESEPAPRRRSKDTESYTDRNTSTAAAPRPHEDVEAPSSLWAALEALYSGPIEDGEPTRPVEALPGAILTKSDRALSGMGL